MKYYFLTHDDRHRFLDDRLYDLLDGTQVVTAAKWAAAGGGRLSSDSPAQDLWGARPGHLLVDARLRAPWIHQFGPDGVLDTVLGDREMFALVPDGARDGIVPDGDWRERHYFHTLIWAAQGMPNQKHSLALRFDLSMPVVRWWQSKRAAMTLYSHDVVNWLHAQGASGVSFSLVWDPDRANPLPLAEACDHETWVL